LFYQLITNSVTENICVINRKGQIVFTNRAWQTFASDNDMNTTPDWSTYNYLRTCERAAESGDEDAQAALNGICQVISGEQEMFYLEYPCHSPLNQRWYSMRVTEGEATNQKYYVISHQDITQRKLAEDRANHLARTDALTGVANRRFFNERLLSEWRRARRQGSELTLAIIDIDYFKELNDALGHTAGDESLVKIAKLLTSSIRRPSDLCGRYGGDEFVLLLPDTSAKKASYLLRDLPLKIRQLSILNPEAKTGPYVTISVGLASVRADQEPEDPASLFAAADHFLYLAKAQGRNRLVWGTASDALREGLTPTPRHQSVNQ
jgi:diguanylate cyclase (GGDEF)-like protein